MSMLMFLYAIGNLNDVSWGTRETQLESKSSISNSQEEMEEEEGHVCSFGKFCTYVNSVLDRKKNFFSISFFKYNRWFYYSQDIVDYHFRLFF